MLWKNLPNVSPIQNENTRFAEPLNQSVAERELLPEESFAVSFNVVLGGAKVFIDIQATDLFLPSFVRLCYFCGDGMVQHGFKSFATMSREPRWTDHRPRNNLILARSLPALSASLQV
jgi:hypothetical protein